MSDKHTKELQYSLVKLLEKREDLLNNVDSLVNNVNRQVQSISRSQAVLSDKEALLTYITKIFVLFSELNHSVLKCMETIHPPILIEQNVNSTEPESNFAMQELHEYLKADQVKINQGITSFFNASEESPKVPNDQIQNNSYVRKPFDVTTLKVICSNIINKRNLTNNPDNMMLDEEMETNSVLTTDSQQQEHISKVQPSPTFSHLCESDILSTISSSAYQHPLLKFHLPTEIPMNYDSHDLDTVKENMKYFSRKMGFNPEELNEMTNKFDKGLSRVNYQFEEPVKEMSVIEPDPTENYQNMNIQFENCNQSEELPKLNNEVEVLIPERQLNFLSNKDTNGPSRGTGAIRKQKFVQEDFIQFSGSNSESNSCDNKVSCWLENNSDRNKVEIQNVNNSDAVEKLTKFQRYDRNEEVRKKARADMPDLRLVPVEIPAIIKNDLISKDSTPEKLNQAKIEHKVKDMNKNVVVYDIQPMNVPEVGCVCIFTHIESPSEFYLQILNDENGSYLDEISEKLDEKFSRTESRYRSKQEAYTRLGKFCYGYIWGERKSWYRLQILNWNLDSLSDEVVVQSVDYGFKCSTPYIYLRDLTSDLAHIPMLALKCHFSMLYAPSSTYLNRITKWPPSTIEALFELCNLSQDQDRLSLVLDDIIIFEIIFVMQEGDSVGVDLVYFEEPNSDSIGQFLIDMELAVEILDDYAENPELGEFLEDIDELESADNLNEFLLGYDAKDEARICRFTRNDGSCFKGKHCKLEHVQLKEGYTTDKTAVFYSSINDLIFPNKGDTIQVLVTTYIDSCTYLVQMIRNPVKNENTNIVMNKDISDLMGAMNHPKLIAKYTPFKIYPALGEMILAYHPIAKHWLRAAVREINRNGEDTTVEVYSVDFGEKFVVNIKNIRIMQEDFMHVPFQIIEIYLDNYQHRKDCNSKKACKFFAKHLAYKNFFARIKSSDLPYKVSLMTSKHREIGPTLIKEGFAEPRSIDLFITDDKFKRRNFDLE